MKQREEKKREKASSDVPQILSARLNHDLGAYAVLAGFAGVAALACAVAADAAPICKHSSAVLVGSESFALNPAGQEVVPFFLGESYINVSSMTCCFWNREFLSPNVPRAGALLDDNNLPAALPYGASIGPAGQFGQGKSYGLLFSYGPLGGGKKTHHKGNFDFAQDNYFGLKFPISGQPHYGWVKLVVKFGAGFDGIVTSTHILEYAYETQPDTPILAGNCSETSRSQVPHPASLGALALGAQGISVWRK